MFDISGIYFGALIILFGCILITTKKFIVKKGYINIVMILFPLLNLYINYIEDDIDFGLGFFLVCFIIVPVSWICIIINRGEYVITNVNNQMVVSTLTSILEEKDIVYEKEKDVVFLKEYDKDISYTKLLNTVNIDLQPIRTLPFIKN